MPIYFKSCREEIAGALQEFCNRWCKQEHVEFNALNSWKLNIFKIIDDRNSFYCNNLDIAGPRSTVGNVSGYRCVSDCRSRGREFDPGPAPYFRGD